MPDAAVRYRSAAAAVALVVVAGCSSTSSDNAGHAGQSGQAGAPGAAGAPTGSAGAPTGSAGAAAGSAGATAGSAGAGTAGATGVAGAGTGGASGASGAGGSAAGGTGGGAGGAGGSSGNSGSGGAAGGDGWVSILPTDDKLTGWFPYVKGYMPGMDPLKTFRRDATTGYLVVTYQDYTGSSFDNHLGLIYYDKKLTNYKVRFEYSFQEPQAKNPVSWGKNNSGLFVFCTDPHQITGNPDFPTGIEIQILGSPSAGGTVNCQICLNSTVAMFPAMIGTKAINAAGGCFASTQSASDFQPAATWTTVEADVDASATGVTKIYQYANGTKPANPIQTITGPVKTGGQTVNSGWISFQSESQPCTFRKIELMELP
ncbi:MAG: DUF1080 domain-containing protein [Pseudomonadota bacterium]